jgi:flagellar biosynthesis chaperone FliJ
MSLQNEAQLRNTRTKLARLETHVDELRRENGGDVELREAEMASFQRLINQLKEEIARYEAQQPAQRPSVCHTCL